MQAQPAPSLRTSDPRGRRRRRPGLRWEGTGTGDVIIIYILLYIYDIQSLQRRQASAKEARTRSHERGVETDRGDFEAGNCASERSGKDGRWRAAACLPACLLVSECGLQSSREDRDGGEGQVRRGLTATDGRTDWRRQKYTTTSSTREKNNGNNNNNNDCRYAQGLSRERSGARLTKGEVDDDCHGPRLGSSSSKGGAGWPPA